MSLPRFFVDTKLVTNNKSCFIPLAEEDLHHAHVLRLKEGEHIALCDNTYASYEYEVDALTQISLVAHYIQTITQEKLPQVTLIQGLAKGERMEFVFRHATEVGVTRFIPLKTERTIVKLDEKKERTRLDRWANIAKSAAEQSGRSLIPSIEAPQTVKQIANTFDAYDCVLLAYEEENETNLRSALAKASALDSVALLIGPEGGFSEQEVNLLVNAGAIPFTLGTTILRTETAGLVASALLIYELGGLGKNLL